MYFASPYAFFPETEEQEEIYQDEIEDGIASCASTQAEIWANEAKSGATGLDPEFVQEIVKMGTKSCSGKGDLTHNDAQTYHNGLCSLPHIVTSSGVFSSTLRLQPRFEKNKAHTYDQKVSQRTHQEKEARRQQKQQQTQLQELKKQQEKEDEEYQKRMQNHQPTSASSSTSFLQTSNSVGEEDVQALVLEFGSGMSKAGMII